MDGSTKKWWSFAEKPVMNSRQCEAEISAGLVSAAGGELKRSY